MMKIDPPENEQQLKQAFQTFSRLSGDLVSTYQVLEHQVEGLTNELAQARAQQKIELEEKQRLAQRLGLLLESLPGGVVVLDGMGVITECNPVASLLLDEPLLNELWRDVVARAFSPRADDGHDVSLKSGLRVNISTCSLGSEPGQILLIKDVTETRRLQDQLAHMQRLSSMGEMAASLAHQIRTPLSTAMLYTGNISSLSSGNEKQKIYANKLKSVLMHMEDLVGDMLTFARTGNLQLEILKISDLLSAIHILVEQNQAHHGIGGTIKCEMTDGVIRGNKEALISVFQNLINNSIQANSDNLEITIICSQNNIDQLQIIFSDNGPGIPENIKKTLFEPFVSQRKGGTGLGLAVAKAVLQAHGGDINIQANNNPGAVFKLELPFTEMREKGGYIK